RTPPPARQELYADDRRRQRRREDAEHVESLKAEHLLDAEPGDCFSLRQHDAEHGADEQVDPEPRRARVAQLLGAELVDVVIVQLDVGARLDRCSHQRSPRTKGSTTKVPSSPPAKNPARAMSDGISSVATREMPCPEGQPPAYAVPNPTRRPPPTMTI